jgi:hypothetical protein
MTQVIVRLRNCLWVSAGGVGTAFISEEFVLDFLDKGTVSEPVSADEECHCQILVSSDFNGSNLLRVSREVGVNADFFHDCSDACRMGPNSDATFLSCADHRVKLIVVFLIAAMFPLSKIIKVAHGLVERVREVLFCAEASHLGSDPFQESEAVCIDGVGSEVAVAT